jgi:IS5 family transposase
MAGQPGFFDLEDRLASLSEAGDPLERLTLAVDFEIFRPALKRALGRSDRGKGGRPPYDPVMMLKILVLQALYGLSDAQAEYQIRDRLSFMRFLGLGLGQRVPDEKTIWLFRELLVRAGAIDKLFDRFEAALEAEGYFAMSGQIVDASLVAAPKQRNTDEEKQAIKEGRVPKDWKDNPAKLRQKDRDARWTLKQGKKKEGAKLQLAIPHYGYKNHIATDRRHGLIRSWDVSDAAANDGKRLKGLLSKENTASSVWADTAYRSKANETFMEKNGFTSQIHHKKPPRRALPETLARANAKRSKVRAAIEHVFAHQKDRMGLFVRTIGLGRARLKIGMVNLAYNMRRFLWLRGRTAPA